MPSKLAAEIKKSRTAKFASKLAAMSLNVFAIALVSFGKIFSSCSMNPKKIIVPEE